MQAQTLFIHATNGTVRSSLTGIEPPKIAVILGTQLVLRCVFHIDGVVGDIGSYVADSLRIAAKDPAEISGTELLLPTGAWEITGSTTTTAYQWTVLADSEELRAFLGDQVTALLRCQAEWEIDVSGAVIRKSQPFDLLVVNSPATPDDGPPSTAADAFWERLKASLGEGEGVTLTPNETTKVLEIIASVVAEIPDASISTAKIQGNAVTMAKLEGDIQDTLNASVPNTRQVATSGLAGGGGDLSANRTIDVPIASQAEAEAGSINTKAMTPLRVAQAIAELAGGGGSSPLTKAIAYVDSTASGSGAAVGNGVPYATLEVAYAAAVAWIGSDPTKFVTLKLAGGNYTRQLGTWHPRVEVEGQGELVTSVTLTSSLDGAGTISMRCRALSLSVNAAAADGVAGSDGTEMGGQDGTDATSGADLTIQIWGARITAFTAEAGSGGTGGNAWDNGSSPTYGGTGGNAGKLTLQLIDCIQAAEFVLYEAAFGSGGGGAQGGSNGSDGILPSPPIEVDLVRLRQDAVPITAYDISSSSNAVLRANRCDLGHPNGGNWSVSGCQYTDNATVTAWEDTYGLPSAPYPAAF